MGYWTSLHLVGIYIKPESLRTVQRAVAGEGRVPKAIRGSLRRMMVSDDHELRFKVTQGDDNPYAPDGENSSPAALGKWYDDEAIAKWLRRHSKPGGRMVLHSIEGDGGAWGWEFDGKGRVRHLDLVPVSRWE